MDNLLFWAVKGALPPIVVGFVIVCLLLGGTHRRFEELREKYLGD